MTEYMLKEEELRELMRTSETNWVERKTSYNPSEVKKTIVAFANSVSEGEHAVLFIGVDPSGKPVHVENADKRQRDIRNLAEQECFPSIRCHPTVVRQNGSEIIAVVVGFSPERPHFAGHAFIRTGSETRKASGQIFEELVASRIDKVRRLLKDKGRPITVARYNYVTFQPVGAMFSGRSTTTTFTVERSECVIDSCDAFVLHYIEQPSQQCRACPVNEVEIDFDAEKGRTRLIIGRRL
ncbi:MAG: ATP-binding protein [Chthoniobacterales bacterium]